PRSRPPTPPGTSRARLWSPSRSSRAGRVALRERDSPPAASALAVAPQPRALRLRGGALAPDPVVDGPPARSRGHQADGQPGVPGTEVLADHRRLGARHALGALRPVPALVRRCAAEMHELRLGHESRAPAEARRPPKEIEVLHVEEAALIEAADVVPRAPADEEHR